MLNVKYQFVLFLNFDVMNFIVFFVDITKLVEFIIVNGYFMGLLVEIGRFQGQLICFKADNLFSSEEVEILYIKSQLLARRIKSRVLHTKLGK